MKGTRLLFGIVVVLLMMISVLPGCNNEEPPVEADELVIPSSMSSYQVFNETANAGPQIKTWPFWQGEWIAGDIDPCVIQLGVSEEQFIEGFGTGLSEFFYTMRNEKRAGYGLYKMVSNIIILRYEDAESAEKSFVNISETQGLQDSTYGGITLKNGTYTLSGCDDPTMWDEDSMACYLIQSNCFIIYLYGREDVANDMLDRIIVAFGVKE